MTETTVKLMEMTVILPDVEGEIKLRRHSNGKWHAVNFGVQSSNIEALLQKVVDLYNSDADDPTSVFYDAQYAYACGYHD